MSAKIPFNRPTVTGREGRYIEQVIENCKFSGVGPMSEQCNRWLAEHLGAAAALVTTSCTHALEMAAMLCDLKSGDEVIMPSFAFPSTAAAFARVGASLVFVDVDPSTMNLDVASVENAVTKRTRVIVALHYAGVGCDMDGLAAIAERNNLIMVEDAAQGIFSGYGSRSLGAIGTFGCLSFHETKNIHCGEGGALIINDPAYMERAEIIMEKGTDKAKFRRGETSSYTWCDLGSSYVPSELNCAFLLAQLEDGERITADRLDVWQGYRDGLQDLSDRESIEIPNPIAAGEGNGHIFWIKAGDGEERDKLLAFLGQRHIMATFHYVPLHTSRAGLRYGRFEGQDRFTSAESRRLLRLPIYFGFRDWRRVVDAIHDFYQ